MGVYSDKSAELENRIVGQSEEMVVNTTYQEFRAGHTRGMAVPGFCSFCFVLLENAFGSSRYVVLMANGNRI